MIINLEMVGKIAALAHLELTDKEKQQLLKDLNNILSYVKQLEEVDVSDVSETSHALDIPIRFREDMIEESLRTEDALKNAPEKKNGYFKVPRVI